nr:unnamed protein product [Digitaria exilis]
MRIRGVGNGGEERGRKRRRREEEEEEAKEWKEQVVVAGQVLRGRGNVTCDAMRCQELQRLRTNYTRWPLSTKQA